MALDGNVLGDLILANVNAVPQPPTDRTALYRAIGNAIVQHFVSECVVGLGNWQVVLGTGGVAQILWYPPNASTPIPIATAPASTPVTGDVT